MPIWRRYGPVLTFSFCALRAVSPASPGAKNTCSFAEYALASRALYSGNPNELKPGHFREAVLHDHSTFVSVLKRYPDETAVLRQQLSDPEVLAKLRGNVFFSVHWNEVAAKSGVNPVIMKMILATGLAIFDRWFGDAKYPGVVRFPTDLIIPALHQLITGNTSDAWHLLGDWDISVHHSEGSLERLLADYLSTNARWENGQWNYSDDASAHAWAYRLAISMADGTRASEIVFNALEGAHPETVHGWEALEHHQRLVNYVENREDPVVSKEDLRKNAAQRIAPYINEVRDRSFAFYRLLLGGSLVTAAAACLLDGELQDYLGALQRQIPEWANDERLQSHVPQWTKKYLAAAARGVEPEVVDLTPLLRDMMFGFLYEWYWKLHQVKLMGLHNMMLNRDLWRLSGAVKEVWNNSAAELSLWQTWIANRKVEWYAWTCHLTASLDSGLRLPSAAPKIIPMNGHPLSHQT